MNDKSKKHELEMSSGVLFILMMIANVLNYSFQVVMGRMFSVQEYGDLNSLFAIFTFTSLPTTSLTLVVSKYCTNYNSKGQYNRLIGFIGVIFKIIVLIAILIFAVGVIFSKLIANFIKISDIKLVIALFFVAGLTTLTAIVLGCFQGIKKFVDYGITNLITPIFKFFGSILLVYLGFHIYGVFGAMAFGCIVVLLVGFWRIKTIFPKAQRNTVKLNFKEILNYIMISLMVNIGISYFTNFDVIIIKHYFSSEMAGIYSSAAVLSKLILYISTAIIVALFPMAVESKANIDTANKILKKAFFYGGGLSILAAIALIILARPMVMLLYGGEYIEAVKYIPILSIMIVVLSLVSILSNYALALNKTRVLILSFGLGIIISIIGSIIFHQTITNIVFVFIVVLTLIFVFNLIVLFNERRINKS